MKLVDLTPADGQHFLGTLTNTFTGAELSFSKKQNFRSALRSFSRFLADSGIMGEDIFFNLKME